MRMSNQDAIETLRRIQEPEEWEPQITKGAYIALDMAISALQAQDSKTRKICKTCKHDPPSKKWPCVDCDMREPADRWELQDVPDTNVGDTISRQAAIEKVRKCRVIEVTPAYMLIDKAEVMTELMMLPSAQPEEVKCKKCRYVYYDKEFGNYWCNRKPDSFMVEEDGYCKWGK